MPCRTDDYYVSQDEGRLVRAELEPLLCEACTILENHKLLAVQASPELKKWYKAHDQREEHRARLEAAEKLSEKERRILGIDLVALQRAAKKSKCQ
jgi:hypothetical protein